MCGILAIQGPYDIHRAMRAHSSMSYRGTNEPNTRRIVSTDEFFCGHNTLPLSSERGTAQPRKVECWGGEKRIGMFVGEIFNWKELSERFPIESTSDTVLANHLFPNIYDDKINRAVHDIDGFWSYVLTDHMDLVAYTDYLAQKPLFYRTDMNAVCSEPEPLTMLADTDIDEHYISNTLKWGYSPDGRTPWKQIKQIPPGCVYQNGEISEYYDWDMVQAEEDVYGLLDVFEKAVKDRVFATKKIGILLSGGIDSSLVYLTAKKYSNDIQSFHIENGESEFVRMVDPDSISLQSTEVTSAEAVRALQTPSDLGSTLPQTSLAKAVNAEGIRAVLTGDGADELFGGYRRAKEYDSQLSDVFSELPYYHFQRLDRIMMRYTIEQRSPFLNPVIVKSALSIPYHRRQEKEMVKTMARAQGVPSEIVDRPKVPLKSSQVKSDPIKHRQELLDEWRKLFEGEK